MKIKWEVSPAPTGPYRSFQKRSWPVGMFNDNKQRVLLRCADEYVPARVKTGDHAEIEVWLDLWNGEKTKLVRMTNRCATLQEAKAQASDFLDRRPQYIREC